MQLGSAIQRKADQGKVRREARGTALDICCEMPHIVDVFRYGSR